MMPTPMRFLVVLTLLTVPTVAAADPTEESKCNDAYSDCHDTCALRYGMVAREKERTKLLRCVDRCKKEESTCLERIFEERKNAKKSQR